jgi:hypothetical protein
MGTSRTCPLYCRRLIECDAIRQLRAMALSSSTGTVQAKVEQCGLIVRLTVGADSPELSLVLDGLGYRGSGR